MFSNISLQQRNRTSSVDRHASA